MSKEIEWGQIHGAGDIVCTCDRCGCTEEVEFVDGPDFREAQKYIEAQGWMSSQINGEWYDFCGMECRRDYIKNYA